MDDFYKEYILDHYRNPRNFGHLESPDAVAEDLNPLCGDQIRIELKVHDGKVEDVRFSGKGCAISQAATSMLTETLRGKPLEDVARILGRGGRRERRDRDQPRSHEVRDPGTQGAQERRARRDRRLARTRRRSGAAAKVVR